MNIRHRVAAAVATVGLAATGLALAAPAAQRCADAAGGPEGLQDQGNHPELGHLGTVTEEGQVRPDHQRLQGHLLVDLHRQLHGDEQEPVRHAEPEVGAGQDPGRGGRGHREQRSADQGGHLHRRSAPARRRPSSTPGPRPSPEPAKKGHEDHRHRPARRRVVEAERLDRLRRPAVEGAVQGQGRHVQDRQDRHVRRVRLHPDHRDGEEVRHLADDLRRHLDRHLGHGSRATTSRSPGDPGPARSTCRRPSSMGAAAAPPQPPSRPDT